MAVEIIRRCSILLISAIAGLGLLQAPIVRADLVNIPLLTGTINMLPNTTSAYQTISVNDLNPGTPVGMTAWSLGFHIVSLGATTGTVTIDTSAIYPTSNNIFPSPYPVAGPSIGTNSPTNGDLSVSAFDFSGAGVTVPGAGANLVQIKFTASANASGNFGLQLVDGGTYQNSFWNDDAPYVDDDHPGNYPHNFLVGGSAFTSGVQLGVISLPAAVPEPSSLLLTGGIAGAATWRSRRRRRSTVAATAATPAG